MWRLVREGLRFYRPVLLISWAIGTGIFVLVVALVAAAGGAGDRAELGKIATQLPLAILLASMIAGFIAIGTERSESRVRLQALLPLRVGLVAAARVVLPAALVAAGLIVSQIAFAATSALSDPARFWSRHLALDFVALVLLFWVEFALAIRELLELRRRAGWGAALAPKVLLAVLAVLMIPLQLVVIEPPAQVAAAAALDAAIMALTAALFVRRTSFVR
jgi:hypothetical protein